MFTNANATPPTISYIDPANDVIEDHPTPCATPPIVNVSTASLAVVELRLLERIRKQC
jgi:hypothetical protein